MFLEKVLNIYTIFTSSFESTFLLRLLIAGACGALIGYERERAFKFAGIRTHAIVATASALLTSLSVYSISSSLKFINTPLSIDLSRIAASIVTGVGFLGTGAILTRSGKVTGLTTAAGIWAVAGIGISVGAGMYILGLGTTVIIFFMQALSHLKVYSFLTPSPRVLYIIVDDTATDFEEYITKIFQEHKVKKVKIVLQKYSREKGLVYKISFHISQKEMFLKLFNQIKTNPSIQSITIHETRFSND